LKSDKNYIHLDKIGERIRFEREKHGLSREAFAEIVGLSPFYIGQIERDERNMSIETLIRICDALNVSIDYILKGYIKYMENISVMETVESNYSEEMDSEIKELLSLLSGTSKKNISLINDMIKLLLPNLEK
jgi:transcriptional regulator with XRE-family HTH domain